MLLVLLVVLTRINNWPTKTEKEKMQQEEINALEKTFEHSDNESSLLNGIPASTSMPGIPVGKATTNNVNEIINKHRGSVAGGSWIVMSLGNKPMSKSLLSKLEAEGLEAKPVPGDSGSVAIISSKKDRKSKASKLLNLLKNPQVYKNGQLVKSSKIDAETRDILDATYKDFFAKGHLYSEAQVDALTLEITRVIANGKLTQQTKAKKAKEKANAIKDKAATFVKETSGIDPATVTQAELDAFRKGPQGLWGKTKAASKWLTEGITKGHFFSAVANQDYYSLLYPLMPTKSGRKEAQKYMKENLQETLEHSSTTYGNLSLGITDSFNALLDTTGVSRKRLTGDSGINLAGTTLSNSQVVKLYNYIKQPATYNQMDRGGVNIDKLSEVLDYLDTNPDLKAFAEGVPNLYAGSKAYINQKLDDHGYKTINDDLLVKPTNKDALALLERVYDGNIPATAPYTPFTATGKTSAVIETTLQQGGDGKFFSAMKGSLIERNKQGNLNILGTSLEGDLENYKKGPIRTAAFLDWAANANAFFSPENMNAMEIANGSVWATSMKDSLERIATGRNRRANLGGFTEKVFDWFNNSIGGIMFLNMRSGTLQLLSSFNSLVQHPKAYMAGITSTLDNKKVAYDAILNSSFYIQRGGGTDITLEEMHQSKGKVAKILKEGYFVTKTMDKAAIMTSGLPLVAGLIETGHSVEEAIQIFEAISKETQQSVGPERLGMESRTLAGRMLLAFSSVNQAYNRVMHRNWNDMWAKDQTAAGRAGNLAQIVFYGGIQNMAFNMLQGWLFSALDLEEDDDDRYKLANGMFDTIARGSGMMGAVLVILKNSARAVTSYDKVTPYAVDKAIVKAFSGVPAVGTKLRQLKNTIPGSTLYKQSNGPYDLPDSVIRTANGIALTTNFPADRLAKKYSALNDLMADDLAQSHQLMRVLGWGRYELGDEVKPGPIQLESNEDDSDDVETTNVTSGITLDNIKQNLNK